MSSSLHTDPTSSAETSDLVDPFWSQIPIDALGLSTRPRNCLAVARFESVADVCAATAEELMALPAFGRSSLDEIVARLESIGRLTLATLPSRKNGTLPTVGDNGFAARQALNTIGDSIATMAALHIGLHGDASVSDLLSAAADDPGTYAPHGGAALESLRLSEVANGGQERYGWLPRLAAMFAAESDRTRSIIESRLPCNKPLTLDEVGQILDLTRERVRQIEASALRHLGADPVIAAAGKELAALVACGSTVAKLAEEGFDLADDMTYVLAATGKQRDMRATVIATTECAGTTWAHTPMAPGALASTICDAVLSRDFEGCCTQADAFEDAVAAKVVTRCATTEDPATIAAALIAAAEYTFDGSVWHPGGASKVDVAERVLRAHGQPMERDELWNRAGGGGSQSSFFDRLGSDDRFFKTQDRKYALVGMDARPYQECAEQMTAVITGNGGKISLRRLISSVSGFSENSVSMYATMDVRFVTVGDVVRLRTPDDALPSNVELVGKALRVVGGPHHGCWSFHADVDYDRMYKGSTSIPVEFAFAVSMPIDQTSVKIATPQGPTFTASCAGMSINLHSRSGFRSIVQSIGGKTGDRMRLIIVGPRLVDIEILPAFDDSDALTAIMTTIATTDPTTAVEDLAFAVGLDSDATGGEVLARLHARHDRFDHTLRDAFLSMFPELDDA